MTIPDKKYTAQLVEPQLVAFHFLDGVEIEQADAKEMIAAATALADGKKYTVLFDATKQGTISMQAREEFAGSKNRIAAAIITNSLANKLISNFFIKFHKPATPTRIFSAENEALDWLREQIRKS